MENKTIKVAFVTDDGNTISPHFGRARFYEVVNIEDGKVTHRECREKAGHHTFHSHEQYQEHHGPNHGFDEHSRGKHRMMADIIADCQMLVARGMGNGAYQHLLNSNIKPIITNIPKIDDAVQEIIKGTIINFTDRLH